MGWRKGMIVAVPKPMDSVAPARIRERDERLDERAVGALHAVRMEDQVVANPDGVEAETFREANAIDEQVLVGILAKVRDEQAEACHDELPGGRR